MSTLIATFSSRKIYWNERFDYQSCGLFAMSKYNSAAEIIEFRHRCFLKCFIYCLKLFVPGGGTMCKREPHGDISNDIVRHSSMFLPPNSASFSASFTEWVSSTPALEKKVMEEVEVCESVHISHYIKHYFMSALLEAAKTNNSQPIQ